LVTTDKFIHEKKSRIKPKKYADFICCGVWESDKIKYNFKGLLCFERKAVRIKVIRLKDKGYRAGRHLDLMLECSLAVMLGTREGRRAGNRRGARNWDERAKSIGS
jgi:hypothetical protein